LHDRPPRLAMACIGSRIATPRRRRSPNHALDWESESQGQACRLIHSGFGTKPNASRLRVVGARFSQELIEECRTFLEMNLDAKSGVPSGIALAALDSGVELRCPAQQSWPNAPDRDSRQKRLDIRRTEKNGEFLSVDGVRRAYVQSSQIVAGKSGR
jgi:plasmid stability protein